MKRFLSLIVIACTLGACATTGGGRFINAVVECSEKTADAVLVANVTRCLTGVAAGGYVQCLELLPFAVDEIICVVQELSQAKAKAINAGTSTDGDAIILSNANEWLKANKISRK